MLAHLAEHLHGKTVIVGIGNTLRSDDGAGSLLAARIKDKTSFQVFDTGSSPENYLGKIIREKPDTIILVDCVDFGGKPGEFRELEAEQIETVNLFATHNASLSLTIHYLKTNLLADIIVLAIQPKRIAFGDTVSAEIDAALSALEQWFYAHSKEKG